ncbi:hypothetical protein GS432_17230 [Rhodococcus hoagii]|nr:hypothetical protein [Prescottella equi]
MTREAPAPDAPDVLDQLHRKLDLLLGDDAPGSPARRASVRDRVGELFVLDERAHNSGFHKFNDAEKRGS